MLITTSTQTILSELIGLLIQRSIIAGEMLALHAAVKTGIIAAEAAAIRLGLRVAGSTVAAIAGSCWFTIVSFV